MSINASAGSGKMDSTAGSYLERPALAGDRGAPAQELSSGGSRHRATLASVTLPPPRAPSPGARRPPASGWVTGWR